jgi:2-hydroxychromene-2-carboxylate isomerase
MDDLLADLQDTRSRRPPRGGEQEAASTTMERLRIPVYYDFASTLSYVAHRVMQRMAGCLDELGIELVWSPIDLTRIAGWPRGAPVEGYPRRNALRVARELGVEVRMPQRWLDSRACGAVALALGGSPREAAWRERVFSAIHEEGRSPDEPGEIERLARDLRLPLEQVLSAETLGELERATRDAREAEVTGVPTFMLDRWPFGGIQEEPTMRSLLERWAARKRGQRPG